MAVTGAIYNHLIFGGVDSADYGIYITGEAVYNAPPRAVDMITVPGRNGSVALDQGRFENIVVTYPAGTFGDDQADFRTALSDFRNAILSHFGVFFIFSRTLFQSGPSWPGDTERDALRV